MKTPKEDTPVPVFAQIVTGHFREGRGYTTWRERGTADWLLIYTQDGRGRFGHANGTLFALPHDVTLLRPGTPHDYGVETTLQTWELVWAHFHPRPHWLEWLHWPETAPGLMQISLAETEAQQTVLARLREANQLATGAQTRREDFAMNALEAALLLCDTANPRSAHARLDSRIRLALDYLHHHLSEPLSVEQIASTSGLSVSRLAHLFRQQIGMTPIQYLEQQRLDRACLLLRHTSRSIQSIAAELGFDSPFYFTQRFKRLNGLSPRDYRKEQIQTAFLNKDFSVGRLKNRF